MSLSGAPQSSSEPHSTQRFGLVVHSVGWDERLDELCGILAGRFNVPAGAAQISLRNQGQATVGDGMSIQEVSAVIEEMSRMGVVAEASLEASSEPASTLHVGWARVASRPRVATVDGTMIGLPRGDGSGDSEAAGDVVSEDVPEPSPDAAASPASDAVSAWTDGAARARAAAIRAAMGAASPAPPVADAAPSEPSPADAVNSPPLQTAFEPYVVPTNTIISEDERIAAVREIVADPGAASPSAWGGVLGAPVPAAPAARNPAVTEGLPTSESAGPPIENELLSAFDALRADGPAARPSAQKDRAFERLRQPVDTQPAATGSGHEWKAGLLSALAPGAGQAYNNEHSRAVTFALAGLFIVPWVVSVVDAFRTARRLDAKGHFIPAPARSFVGVIIGFWVLIGALGVLYTAVDRATEPDPVPDIVVVPPPAVVPAPVAEPDPQMEIEQARLEEQQRVERRERVAGLVARARLACGAGDYVECRRLAEDALEVDESDPDAQRVHVEAVVGQSGSSIDYPEPPLDE